jgi:hypothetical protein
MHTQCIYVFRMILTANSINQFAFVTVKCCVFFAVRTELNMLTIRPSPRCVTESNVLKLINKAYGTQVRET